MASREKIEEFLAEPRNAIVIGLRRDGSPQATPNWFSFDGEHFYVSTTRKRAKYQIFSRDPRVELVIDDPVGRRYIAVSGTVHIHEEIEPVLSIFRTTRRKYSIPVPSDAEFLAALTGEGRVLLEVTPNGPMSSWRVNGLD